MRARALSGEEWVALRLARLVATERMPYFAHALFSVIPVAAEGLGTFAVDARWRLYVDPELLVGVNRWSPQVAGAVLLHEIGHLLREHAERTSGLTQPVNRKAWNYAADAEINDDLIAAGVPLPEGVITPATLGQADGGIAEDYYEACVSTVADADDEPGCGSGAGTGSIDGELPGSEGESSSADDVGGGHPAGLGAEDAAIVRRMVAQAVQASYGGTGIGNCPAALQRWATEVLAPPTVPWSRVLAATVRRAVGDRAGQVNYSFTRPSRRRVPGVLLPGMRAPQISVSVVIDTSGSMSADDLSAALSEIVGVTKAAGVQRDRLTVLSCDASSTKPIQVRDPRHIELVGGGGTDMRVGIAGAMEQRPRPDVIVVLTDGYTPWPELPVGAQLVCAIIGDSAQVNGGPDWARSVFVPIGAGAA